MKHFADIVKKAKPVQGKDLVLKASNIGGDVRIKYKDQSDFERIAGEFGIFEEWKVILVSFFQPIVCILNMFISIIKDHLFLWC